MKKLVLLFSLLMAACSGPVPISATPRSISYDEVTRPTLPEVTDSAQAHCDTYNRSAELVSYDQALALANFKCVDGPWP